MAPPNTCAFPSAITRIRPSRTTRSVSAASSNPYSRSAGPGSELEKEAAGNTIKRIAERAARFVSFKFGAESHPFRGVVAKSATTAEGKIGGRRHGEWRSRYPLWWRERIRISCREGPVRRMDSADADNGIWNDARFRNRNAQVKSEVEIGDGEAERFRGVGDARHGHGAPDAREVAEFGKGHEFPSQRIDYVAAAHHAGLVDAITGADEAAHFRYAFPDDRRVLCER